MLLVTLRISMKARFLPTQLYGPVERISATSTHERKWCGVVFDTQDMGYLPIEKGEYTDAFLVSSGFEVHRSGMNSLGRSKFRSSIGNASASDLTDDAHSQL